MFVMTPALLMDAALNVTAPAAVAEKVMLPLLAIVAPLSVRPPAEPCEMSVTFEPIGTLIVIRPVLAPDVPIEPALLS